MSNSQKYHIDMTRGPIFSKLLLFSIPLMLSGILQLSFNAADMAVAGRFASHEALAAIGATTSLFHLLIGLCQGLSIGVTVVISKFYGSRDHASLSKSVHTAIAMAIYGGLIAMTAALLLARPMLKLMGTPAEIFESSCLYLWLIIAGVPVLMVNNFGGAILRAVGDTRRPLYFLIAAGIVNVILNLVFVILFRMSVAGVALATILSNGLSAALVLRTLMRENGSCRFSFKQMKINYPILRKMVLIGLPAGIQGCFFSFSNLTIQSSINSFGSEAMAGSMAAYTFEAIVYTIVNSFHQAVISFCSQNLGSKSYQRIPKVLLYSTVTSVVMTAAVGIIFIIFSEPLLAIFNTDLQVIQWGKTRLLVLLSLYSLCSLMEISTGALRGLGHSNIPAVSSLLTICGTRLVWVGFVFPHSRSMGTLMASYPISWTLNTLICGAFLVYFLRPLLKSQSKLNRL
ncbi:MAG: MATE family efflux transporter [Victivallales bacterium]|nr:MATE family efflux transporter [Victivallales bacterium]